MEFEEKKVPEVVSFVALGESKTSFFHEAVQTGNPRGVADEVWTINKLAVVMKHDMLFRMDDLKVKYDCNNKQYSGGNVKEDNKASVHENYDNFLRNHDKPIVTSKAYPEYPMSLEYPLEKVINFLGGHSYFRTTPSYVAAFALYLGVKQLRLYGCDYVYPKDKYKGESGRANLEFILALCLERGMDIWTPPKTTLLDTNVNVVNMMYGYKDPVEVKEDKENPGKWIVTHRPDVGKDKRNKEILKEKGELQKLLLKYKSDVVHDLIVGNWITHEIIEDVKKHQVEDQEKQQSENEKTETSSNDEKI